MSIGTTIRTYRKEKHMTQEEMANRLGVTAPAVNKWENENSSPDISLLAPIARLLGISTDTLLGYEESLTEQELNRIVLEINDKLKTDDYNTAFSLAMEKIQTYPNCEALIFNLAPLLNAYLLFFPSEETEKYYKTISDLYHRLLKSDNPQIVNHALLSLFSNALSRQDYDKAQEYLNRLPRQDFNPDQNQAVLYEKQNKIQEAYPLYEKLLFSQYFGLSTAFQGLYRLAMKENDLKRASDLIEKQKSLAQLLEMGSFVENSCEWDYVVSQQDVNGTLRILETLIENIDNMDSFKDSDLYRHMNFSKNGTENLSFILKKSLKLEDDSPDFLKENEKYKELMQKIPQ